MPFFLRYIFRTKPGKRALDKFFLKIPIISPLVQKTNAAYTVRTIGSLVSSGVPIVTALEITAGVLGNIYFREAMLFCAQFVRKGGKLSEALKNYKDLYPPVVIQMIEVGEETGETSEILQKLADFFEDEVALATKSIMIKLSVVL